MDYAAAYPDRVDKLILLDTAPVAFQYLAAFEDNILDRLSTEERDQLATLERTDSPQSGAAIAKLETKGLFFDRKSGSNQQES
jgi:pimeloyl-ACP methyl ester carboxylesterase